MLNPSAMGFLMDTVLPKSIFGRMYDWIVEKLEVLMSVLASILVRSLAFCKALIKPASALYCCYSNDEEHCERYVPKLFQFIHISRLDMYIFCFCSHSIPFMQKVNFISSYIVGSKNYYSSETQYKYIDYIK